MSKFQVGDKVRILAPTLEGMEGLVTEVTSQSPGVYKVQVKGWGIFSYYGANLEAVEAGTLEQE